MKSRGTPAVVAGQGKLRAVFGLPFGVGVTVSGCIGVGILSQPGTVARHLPHPGFILAAWLVGGLYVLLGAVSVAELAAMIPWSGGFYIDVRRALGEYAGFVTGWGSWLALTCSGALVATIFGDYIVKLVPALAVSKRGRSPQQTSNCVSQQRRSAPDDCAGSHLLYQFGGFK